MEGRACWFKEGASQQLAPLFFIRIAACSPVIDEPNDSCCEVDYGPDKSQELDEYAHGHHLPSERRGPASRLLAADRAILARPRRVPRWMNCKLLGNGLTRASRLVVVSQGGICVT